MWLVADDDTKIYILGTMHALPRGTDWDAGRVASAIKAADELRMELSPAELAAAGEMFRRSEEHTSELQSLMRISYAVFCLKTTTDIQFCTLRHPRQQRTT